MRIAARDGLDLCPESAIAASGLASLVTERQIQSNEEVVLFNTATALKYAELL
jgi:threonine synthase